MKLIATATLAVAINASPVVFEESPYPIGPLPLSNARFADGEWNEVCGEPAKAIDGLNIGLPDHPVINKKEMVHSKYQYNNEFLVDLPERAVVTEVVFYPRNSVKWADHWGRYAGLQVFVGDTPCVAQNKLGPQDVKAAINSGLKWSCDYFEGATVSVKNNNWIHLNELTVDGYIIPLDPCENNGCLNGSTCVADEEEEKGYQCVCPITVENRFKNRETTAWSHHLKGEFCEFISVKTPDKYSYKKIQPFGYDLSVGTDKISFEFQVAADNDAHLLFCGEQVILDKSQKPGEWYGKCLELVIGGWGNTQSIFRSSPQSDENPIVPFVFDSPLSGTDNFVTFNIDFNEDGSFNLFKDGELFMSADNWKVKFDEIVKVGVSTGWGSDGHWLFDVNEVSFQ